MARKNLFTSESVTEGHPDKICDKISDALLDYALRCDPAAHVAVDGAQVKTQFVSVVGEVTAAGFDAEKVEGIVRDTIRRIGYINPSLGFDYENCRVRLQIEQQSPDIAMGVTRQGLEEQGAGDQGLMFGYAIAHTQELMPLPISLAHRLTQRLSTVRKNGHAKYLWPDGKSQVTVEFNSKRKPRVDTVVLSAHHSPEVTQDYLQRELMASVIEPVCGAYMDVDTKVHVNPTGKFTVGGPLGDSGLTGRKIIVDTYGGWARHGGGAFSGKDPSKVDRSAAYFARYIAKSVVAAGLADACEVQLAYAIGVAKPVSIRVEADGISSALEEKIARAIGKVFDARPGMIIKNLDLRRPIYEKTAAYGHFGREDPDFTWERMDKAEELREAVGAKAY